MMRKITTRTLTLCLAAAASLAAIGCGANQEILKSGQSTPAAAPTPAGIKEDLDAMKTANFSYVIVLRRRDGGSIDAEDRAVIKQNTANANRRISAEDGHAFVIGSNFALDPANMAALNARFAVEDHSEAPTPTPASNALAAKANANAKAPK